MKYASGDDIRPGDAVRLQNGELAEIVAVGDGVLVRTAKGALVRYDSPDGYDLVQVGPA